MSVLLLETGGTDNLLMETDDSLLLEIDASGRPRNSMLRLGVGLWISGMVPHTYTEGVYIW